MRSDAALDCIGPVAWFGFIRERAEASPLASGRGREIAKDPSFSQARWRSEEVPERPPRKPHPPSVAEQQSRIAAASAARASARLAEDNPAVLVTLINRFAEIGAHPGPVLTGLIEQKTHFDAEVKMHSGCKQIDPDTACL